MNGTGRDDDDAPSGEFEKLMRDVPGVRRVAPAGGAARRASRPRVTRAPLAGLERVPGGSGPDPSLVHTRQPTPIRVETIGERIEGRADGVDMRQLKRLRRGEIPCDREIDLHGMTAATAKPAVIEAILSARTHGMRCLRVVHGRGRRSPDGRAVLRSALADWLMEPNVAGELLAVATDDSHEGGGTGATWILLRRGRPR